MASLGEGLKTSSNELNKECAKPSSAPKNESGVVDGVTSTSLRISFGATLARSLEASLLASFGASLVGATGAVATDFGASRVLLMT